MMDAVRQLNAHIGYDAELQRHNEVFRRACNVQAHDHVLDIGCGAGQTTRQAAWIARAGSAFGLDVSLAAIERARRTAAEEGLTNIGFECADAQDYPFPAEHFDVAISRFGTMFFDDPTAAFANIRRALRPAGRLVMLVWQASERNEWHVTIRRSLEAAGAKLAAPARQSDPFSLADPATVTTILDAAGFTAVGFADVQQPVCYGPDAAAAMAWVRGFTCTNETLKQLDSAAAQAALGRLQAAIANKATEHGVWFGSRAWIVTAHRD
jgi:ubiquinone/menaquinone biosynthesis C-methylase UbiE